MSGWSWGSSLTGQIKQFAQEIAKEAASLSTADEDEATSSGFEEEEEGEEGVTRETEGEGIKDHDRDDRGFNLSVPSLSSPFANARSFFDFLDSPKPSTDSKQDPNNGDEGKDDGTEETREAPSPSITSSSSSLTELAARRAKGFLSSVINPNPLTSPSLPSPISVRPEDSHQQNITDVIHDEDRALIAKLRSQVSSFILSSLFFFLFLPLDQRLTKPLSHTYTHPHSHNHAHGADRKAKAGSQESPRQGPHSRKSQLKPQGKEPQRSCLSFVFRLLP